MEEKLMEQIREGDQNAWEAYFRKHNPGFLKFACSLVGDEEVAAAIVHKVFIKLWEKRRTFDTLGDMHYKFYSEIRYRSKDHFKGMASNREFAVAGDVLETLNIADDEEVINKYLKEKLYIKLYAEIDLLPDRCRQVMILHFKKGMQVKDIADKLGIKHNTVSTQIKNGLEELRSSLLEQLKRVKDNPSLSDIELLLIYTLLYVESALFLAF